MEGRRGKSQGARTLFHSCIASQLLPGGNNFDLARAWHERMFGLHAELREEFEDVYIGRFSKSLFPRRALTAYNFLLRRFESQLAGAL